MKVIKMWITTISVILVINVVLMIIIILFQKGAGGGVGLGSSANSLFNIRGSSNILTKLTSVLATIFLCLAFLLSIMTRKNHQVFTTEEAELKVQQTPKLSSVEEQKEANTIDKEKKIEEK